MTSVHKTRLAIASAIALSVLAAVVLAALPTPASAATARTIAWKPNGTIASVGPLRTPRTYWGPKGKTLFKKFGRRANIDLDRRSQICTVDWRKWGVYTQLGPLGYLRKVTCAKLAADRLWMRNTTKTTWTLQNGLNIGDPVARINELFPASEATREFLDADHDGAIYVRCLLEYTEPPAPLVNDATIKVCTLRAHTYLSADGTPEYVLNFEAHFPRPLAD